MLESRNMPFSAASPRTPKLAQPPAPSPETVPSGVAALSRRAREVAATWLSRAHAPPGERWLLAPPGIGPSCEMLLADGLFHDLSETERDGLADFVRAAQGNDGAWRDVSGQPDLSLTVLGWWARLQCGDDPESDSMIRARRLVHALGGAQRADFTVRVWLAMAGHIPWSYLPAIPGELFLLPEPTWASPSRFSPWARGMLLPYYVIARAPARLHLADVSSLLLERRPSTLVAPRLTRPGLAGDVLQAFDRTVRLVRKLPRGAVSHWALQRAQTQLLATQQPHGGWFSFRPTLLGLVALRVMGLCSDDQRILSGLSYLRAARGWTHAPGDDPDAPPMLAQGSGGPPVRAWAPLAGATAGSPHDLQGLLAQELRHAGPWQARADAAAGGWPREPDGNDHLDLDATCQVLEALSDLPTSTMTAEAWSAYRRAVEVIVAMQEPHGGFSRFERGETRVLMRNAPWTDADLLAFGSDADVPHLQLTARVLCRLGRTGFRADDDRVARAVRWLASHLGDHRLHDVQTLGLAAEGVAAACPPQHELRIRLERQIRSRQREDGSFGSLTDTARAVRALLELGPRCVQVDRALSFMVRQTEAHPELLERDDSVAVSGGPEPPTLDPSAAAREICRALGALEREA